MYIVYTLYIYILVIRNTVNDGVIFNEALIVFIKFSIKYFCVFVNMFYNFTLGSTNIKCYTIFYSIKYMC